MDNRKVETSPRPSYENLDQARTFDHVIIGCFTMLILGFSFMFIFFGIMHLFAVVVGYSKPVYQVIGRFFMKNSEQEFVPFPLSFSRILSLIPMIAFGLMYLGLGFWTLVKFGFLGQNLIYIFLHFGLHII